MAFSGGTFSRTFDCTTDRDNGVKILASKFDTELDGMATGLSTTILKDGTQTCTAAIPFAQGITLPDDKTITFGTNSDVLIQYDETTTDSLKISAAEGAGLAITLMADEGDDAGDEWKLNIADGGTLTLGNDINSAGTYVTHLTITPNATVANSTMAVAGNLTVGGALTLGSGAVISEAELETIDGITPGTVLASKAMVVDADKDITGGRNLTITGELDAATLDISGNADIDGTLEADAMTLNGSAITTVATLSTGISNGNLPVFTSGAADDDFLRIDGTAIEGRSASEVLSDIGAQASLTFGISNTNAVKIDSASVADDEFARFTANGLESRSTSEVLSDIAAAPAAGSSNVVTTGALNSGSITSGFGSIDNGSSAITTTGTVSAGDVAVGDDVTVAGRASGHVTTDNDGSFDLAVGNDFKCTTAGGLTLTFTNAAAGQSGNIMFVNGGNHTIAAHADVAINADVLTAISATGTYYLAYYCSAASGNNTILVSGSAILT
jgi:cytoskeletal protein CcmA (bactofilin family)